MSEPTSSEGRISRRRALGLLGASAVGALGGVRSVHPLVPLQEGETWRSRLFDPEQLERVATLAETIIPETETPGARGALVHQYIDWVLSEEDAETAQRFTDGLAWLEQECAKRFGHGLLQATAVERHDLLAGIAAVAEKPEAQQAADGEGLGAEFFRDLKARTIQGYYRSEVGMVQELGFDGNRYLRRFEGCRHPEHHAWSPSAQAAGAEPEP